MTKIYKNILETIGNTPLVKINKLAKESKATILAKLESFNPLSSVKDRIGIAMIEAGEKEGKINKDTVIIEPTSGNTGIALAFACAAKGYKLVLTMPETMSVERRQLLKILGAELVLTEGPKGMNGAVEKANELVAKTKNSFMPQQFDNPANTEIHRKTTAVEILNDADGKIDFFVAGIGTGGTITGVGEILKAKNGNVKIIGVEPKDSPLLSKGTVGPHKIQGIGANFIPKILNRNIIDEIIAVDSNDAGSISRRLAKEEGILAGISSGAAMWAAIEIGKRKENEGKIIVVVLPDSGERYLSTWLFQE
ncbi:MAG: cysteine synthase A [Candidatus Humimicrobiaceae bacterium]